MALTTTDLLRLQTWLSPAFPTGGFAHSHGLEWAIQEGDVQDAASLLAWLDDVIRRGSGRCDAILLRHAHAAWDRPRHLARLGEFALASQPARERRSEALGQGVAFVAAARAWRPGAWAVATGLPHAVAVGALAGRFGIDADATAASWLQAFAANLVSAAVRLIPLGQSAGLAVVGALEPVVLAVAEASRDQGLDALGGACLRADIAAMRHETQETRLFRT